MNDVGVGGILENSYFVQNPKIRMLRMNMQTVPDLRFLTRHKATDGATVLLADDLDGHQM